MKKLATVKEYFDSLPPLERKALISIRKTIQAAAPEATEKMSYGMPFFFHKGMLVAYAVFSDHCSLFVIGEKTRKKLKKEIAPYLKGKSTLQFTAQKPLPKELLKKIVQQRIKENETKNM